VVFSFQGWAVDVTSDVRLLKLEQQTLIASKDGVASR
jgi:hypothetical protein